MPFNKFELIADYKFWVKFEDWSIEEMTPLLLGYNPIYIDRKFLDQLSRGEVETSMTKKDIEFLIKEYDKAYALIMNSIEAGKLKFRVSPKKFYDWAVSKEVPIFDEFHKAIQCKKLCIKEHEINPKRKKQLYKIILSLAIKYKFNPEKTKNPHTAKIRDAIHRSGLNIDDNTIREVVRTSYELYKEDLDHSVFEN